MPKKEEVSVEDAKQEDKEEVAEVAAGDDWGAFGDDGEKGEVV